MRHPIQVGKAYRYSDEVGSLRFVVVSRWKSPLAEWEVKAGRRIGKTYYTALVLESPHAGDLANGFFIFARNSQTGRGCVEDPL